MAKIIISTGFSIHDTPYYTPFAKDNVISDEIFNRSLIKSTEYTLAAYFRDNDIHTSSAVNKVYEDFRDNPTYENLMIMVDLATEIFKDDDFLDFIARQMGNPHISSASVMFCSDLLNGKISELGIYGNMPYSSRFAVDTGLTTEKVRQRVDNLVKQRRALKNTTRPYNDVNKEINTWVDLFSALLINKNDFLCFYKYVLCDYY